MFMVIAEFVRFLCFLFLVSKIRETIAVHLFFLKSLLKGATLTQYPNKQALLIPARKRSPLQWWQQAVAVVTAAKIRAQTSKSLPWLLLFPLHHFPSTNRCPGPGLGPSIHLFCDGRHSKLTLYPQNSSTGQP